MEIAWGPCMEPPGPIERVMPLMDLNCLAQRLVEVQLGPSLTMNGFPELQAHGSAGFFSCLPPNPPF
jgi:hypothetical protein